NCESGAAHGTYSFGSCFESALGTNPEELLAAAHACCFAMTLCSCLEKAGTPASRLEVSACCTSDKVADQLKFTAVKLSVRGSVQGIDAGAFQRLAAEVKESCPVSIALRGGVRD